MIIKNIRDYETIYYLIVIFRALNLKITVYIIHYEKYNESVFEDGFLSLVELNQNSKFPYLKIDNNIKVRRVQRALDKKIIL